MTAGSEREVSIISQVSPPPRGATLTRRGFLGAAAGAAATLTVGGCGSAGGGGSTKEISFWSQLAGSKKKAGLALEAAFGQTNPGLNVVTSLYGSPDQLNQKLLTGIVGGVVPDLFIQHWDYSIIYAAGNKLTPLTGAVDPSSLDPHFAGFSTLNGQLVTAPLYGTSRALTINAAIARDAGLDVSRPPTSWEDLRRWGRAMTRRDGDRLKVAGFHLYGNDLELFEIFTLLLQGAGGSLLSEDRRDVTLDSAAGVDAVEFLASLVLDDRVTTPGFGIGDSATSSPLASKRAGMSLNGNYSLNAAETAKIDLVVAPFPRRENGFTSLIDPFCFGVPAQARAASAARQFISFAMSREQQVAFAVASRNIPALTSAQSDPKLTADRYLAGFVKAASYAPINSPTTPGFTRFAPVVSRAIQNVFYGRDAPASALRLAADQLRPTVAREGATA